MCMPPELVARGWGKGRETAWRIENHNNDVQCYENISSRWLADWLAEARKSDDDTAGLFFRCSYTHCWVRHTYRNDHTGDDV